MIDLPPPPAPPPLPYRVPAPEPARFRPTAAVAWAVIVGVIVLLTVLRNWHVAVEPTTRPAELSHVDAQTEAAGRMWVGFGRLLKQSGGDDGALDQFAALPQETPADRMAAAIVLADRGRADRAIALLRQTDDPQAGELLNEYESAAGPSTAPATARATGTTSQPATTAHAALSPALHERLGWFAKLADTYGEPDNEPVRAALLASAERAATVITFAVVVGGALFLVGLGLFITAIVLLATKKLRFAVGRPVGRGHVYVEALAIYLAGFIVASLVLSKLLPGAGLPGEMVALGVVVVIAALWPQMRGVPAAAQRQDWGVHAGRGVFREIACGVLGYLAGLPIIALGLILTALILLHTGTTASHPIQQQFENSTPDRIVFLYVLAAVFAPLTEELLFRGALVSHLRAALGVVAAALLSALIFGAVHPQGWAVVPALMAIGTVLAVVRQWRGSLIASITAHALHNGVLVTMMVLLLR